MHPNQPMQFTLLRVPFVLEPDYAPDPAFEEPNRTRLTRKWGGLDGWERQKRAHRLKERGREVGIEHFNLDRIASNTMRSHRLVQFVTKTLGINASETMYNDLNKLHFEKGRKLNDVDMLVEVAVAVGMDEDEARRFLASSEGLDEIAAAQEVVRGLGISGIPTLCLGGKYMLPSGAVGSSTIIDAFRAIEGRGGATGSLFADALGIPDHVMEQTLNLG